MNEREIQALPSNIRSKFREFTDEEFADHTSVISLRKTLESAEAKHREIVLTIDGLRARKTTLEEYLAEIKAAQQTARDELQDTLVSTLLKGQVPSPTSDPGAQFDPIVSAVHVAQSTIDQRMAELSQKADATIEATFRAGQKLRDQLDELKLAEARRLAA